MFFHKLVHFCVTGFMLYLNQSRAPFLSHIHYMIVLLCILFISHQRLVSLVIWRHIYAALREGCTKKWGVSEGSEITFLYW